MRHRLLAPWSRAAWMLTPGAWTVQTGWYLAYRAADYVVLNLGEDAALIALAFC
ncbi:MAG: hypothetical protein HXX19_02910 [Rhodoferax sp.]|nr:hypothetical protein [Rhodoferax sp.]